MIVSYDRKWEGEVRECGGMNECKSGIKRVFDVFIDLRRPHYRDTTNTKTASCGHRPVLGSHTVQIWIAYTVQNRLIALMSVLIEMRPSFFTSQVQVAADCMPAPLFC